MQPEERRKWVADLNKQSHRLSSLAIIAMTHRLIKPGRLALVSSFGAEAVAQAELGPLGLQDLDERVAPVPARVVHRHARRLVDEQQVVLDDSTSSSQIGAAGTLDSVRTIWWTSLSLVAVGEGDRAVAAVELPARVQVGVTAPHAW